MYLLEKLQEKRWKVRDGISVKMIKCWDTPKLFHNLHNAKSFSYEDVGRDDLGWITVDDEIVCNTEENKHPIQFVITEIQPEDFVNS